MSNNLAFKEVQNGFQHTIILIIYVKLSKIGFIEETGFLNWQKPHTKPAAYASLFILQGTLHLFSKTICIS